MTASTDGADSYVWLLAFPLTLVIIFTVLGNVAVVLAVFCYRPLRIVQNFFLVSLAISDLAVALFVMPFSVAYVVLGRWSFGKLFCEMWLAVDVLCCTSSILNLCVIAIDRYWAITDAVNYATKRTFRRVASLTGSVWIISLLISLPALFQWNEYKQDSEECELYSHTGYVLFSAMGSFYIPLLIMCIVNVRTFLAARKTACKRPHSFIGESSAHIDALQLQCLSTATTEPPANQEPPDPSKVKMREKTGRRAPRPTTIAIPTRNLGNPVLRTSLRRNSIAEGYTDGIAKFFVQQRRISISRERRAARTLGVVMVVFVCCWLPFFVMYLMRAFCEECVNKRVMEVFYWLGYFNSCANPIIYTIFNRHFRQAFLKFSKLKIMRTC